MSVSNRSGSANIDFEVFGQHLKPAVPLDMVFRPDSIGSYILKKIEHLAGDLGKIILQGLEIAGKEIANGATTVGMEVYGGVTDTGEAIAGAASTAINAIGGLFASSPNDWDKTFGMFPIQAFWYEWFAQVYRPDRFRHNPRDWYVMIDFWNPFWKAHKHGWSPWFSPVYYLDNNPDLIPHAMANRDWYNAGYDTNFWSGYGWLHPNDWDLRTQANDPNSEYYKSELNVLGRTHELPIPAGLYPKSTRYPPNAMFWAFTHWLNAGLKEGRVGSNLFNAQYYYFKYPDVARAYRHRGWWGAMEHYMSSGMAEGRQGAPKIPGGTPPPGVNQSNKFLPCRALVGNKFYVGVWWHSQWKVTCDISLGADGYRTPVFDVLIADSSRFNIGLDKNPVVPGFTSPVAGYDVNGNPNLEVCMAGDTSGQLKYGFIENGTCWILNEKGKQMAGIWGGRIYMQNPRWVTP